MTVGTFFAISASIIHQRVTTRKVKNNNGIQRQTKLTKDLAMNMATEKQYYNKVRLATDVATEI